ncbi:MAG: DUF4373 domain-containing protein [Bacteroidales bacterium]|nr:DUF4373 domain-containing protein [Bacteroidales bacterium]
MKNYFSHDYYATLDPKIIALLGDYGAVGYGIYWRIVEMLHSENEHKLPLKEYIIRAIAKQMSTSVEQTSAFINDCINVYELFIEEDGNFYSKRVLENIEKMENIKEKRSNAGKISAEKRKNATCVEQSLTSVQQNSTSVQQNLTQSNKIKENKIKENKIKEIKDINKDCFVADKSAIKTKDLEFRKNEFKNNLEPFLEIYGKDLLNDFFRYWTEHNPDGKKMRFEMEKVFDISKRLKTWSNNENKFKRAGGISEREKRLEGVAQLKADAAAILNHLNVKLS